MNRVLVVDDEIRTCENLVKILVKKGYSAFAAHNGVEALEFLNGHDVEVVLLDMRMPVMDGITALKRIKEDHPDTVAIMVTAISDKSVAEDCIKAGAFSYLDKPINFQELFTEIGRALEHRGSMPPGDEIRHAYD